MKLKLLLTITALGLCTTATYSDYYGRLTGIVNHSPYKVTVQTSDTLGGVTLTDGTRPNIQNKEFDLAQIQSMNLVVPENRWSGDATIHVRVYSSNKKISQIDLTDRNGRIWAHDRVNNKDLYLNKSDDQDLLFYLKVGFDGYVDFGNDYQSGENYVDWLEG